METSHESTQLILNSDPRVKKVFLAYPPQVREKMEFLRSLVMEVAQDSEGISTIEETLKWGEPSYLVKKGSTIRMDWKSKSPHQYALYFKCTSSLVPTFRSLYEGLFHFEGNRAIVFSLDDDIPVPELKSCITSALHYHKVKHLPSLGI